MSTKAQIEQLLTRAEVAAMFGVAPVTVSKWAKAGKLTSLRTVGGHRRYREAEVRELRCVQDSLSAQQQLVL
jgi:excisionase family DNA binding protein